MFETDPPSLLALAARYVLYAFLLYYLILFPYRVFLHPLRKYPGPPLAKITNAYAGYHALLRQLHIVTYQDHIKYGPVYRAGPNKLVFNTIEAVEAIYKDKRFTKSRVYLLTMQPEGVESVFTCLDRERHRERRQLISNFISDQLRRRFEDIVRDQVRIYLGQLLVASQEPTASVVNITERCKRLSLDIIGLLAFGFQLRTQTDDKYRFMIKGMEFRMHRGNSLLQFPALKNWFLDNVVHAVTRKGRIRYLKVLEHMIWERKHAEQDAEPDFYSVMANQARNGRPDSIKLTAEELTSEAVFFFPAGGDTISTGLSALFFYLSRYPEAYHKLAREIRTTFADANDITGSRLSDCRFLRACFNEALRLSPPVSGTLWYELTKEERQKGDPFVVGKDVIPPDTTVGVNIYSLQHNEKYFPDPFVFKPERWLDNDSARAPEVNPAFLAFSTGPRGCAGKKVAYLEAGLVVANTFWYFDFDTAPGADGAVGGGKPGNRIGRQREDEFQLYDKFTAAHDGPNLVFRARGDYWKDL